MIDIEQIAKEISKRTGIGLETVQVICKHPFIETVRLMKDENNIQNILFNQLFKFKLKRRFKEDKTQKYSSK